MSMYRVFSWVVGRGCCYEQCILLVKLYQPLPCFILYSKAKFAFIPGISWLPTFAFQSPLMKRTSFGGVSSKRSYRSSQSHSTSASSALLVRAKLGLTVILNGLPWKWTEIILSFLKLHPSTAFQTLLLTMMATPFFFSQILGHCCCCCCVTSVVSDSVRPHRRQPTRLPVPGILQARPLEWVAISFSNAWKWKVKVKSLSRVWL